jgi:hypothetical protein
MVAFDLLAALLLIRWLPTLGLGPNRLRLAVYAYALLGLTMGHLLYDRLDVVIAAIFIAFLAWLPRAHQRTWPVTLVAWAGILFKIVPLFWLPLIWIGEWFGRPRQIDRLRIQASDLRFFAGRAALHLVPPTLVLAIWKEATDGGLANCLGEHSERGIEIESVWATPIWVWRTFVTGEPVPLINRWGAHHLDPAIVGTGYLWFAKYLGFGLLGAFFLWLFFMLWRRSRLTTVLEPEVWLLAAAAMQLLLLVSQRVLSPQYLIWNLPALAAIIAWSRSYWPGLTITCAYLLTWDFLARSYPFVLAGEPLAVTALAVRNLLLVILTVWLVTRLASALAPARDAR